MRTRRIKRFILFSLILSLSCLALVGCVTRRAIISEHSGNSNSQAEIKIRENKSIPKANDSLQGPLKITINEAVLLGMENNRALRVERTAPAIRRTFEEQENAVFDPDLKADFSFTEKNIEITDERNQKTDSSAASIGVAKLFRSGTNVELDISTNKSRLESDDEKNATRAGLKITQPLLKGVGSEANLAKVRRARLDTLVSIYELRGFTEALVANIESTYWDYALAEKEIEIFTESLKLANDQLYETLERIKVGKLAETELVAAKAEVALRNEALINARSKLETTHLKLLRLISAPRAEGWQRKIVLKDQLAEPDIELDDVSNHVEIALQMRADLNEARLGIQRGNLEIVETANGLLPKLDLFIAMGKTGYADSFSGSFENITEEHYDISAGLSFQFPAGNRRAKAQYRNAKLSTEQSTDVLKNLIQLVEVDVRAAFIEVKRTAEQVPATSATLQLQAEKQRAEIAKFRVGKSRSLLVAQAQRDLLESQISKIGALVNYHKALIDLYRLEGTLLERRGVLAPGAAPPTKSF